MAKAILLSLLVATLAIPTFAARSGSARRGLGAALWSLGGFAVLYWLSVMFFSHSRCINFAPASAETAPFMMS